VKTKWIQELKQYRPDTPFILVGTQSDKRNIKADDTEHVQGSFIHEYLVPTKCVSASKGKSAARKLGAKQYLECSALKCDGVSEVFKSAFQTAMCPKKRKQSFLKTCMPAFKFRKFSKNSRVEE
jgi:GTPase SAR1 family protein